MDSQWQKRVVEQLEKLKSHRKDQLTEIWNNNRKLLNENYTPSCEWKIKDKKEKGKLITISAFISGEKYIKQKVRASQLSAPTPMPQMKMWIPIPRNFMVPDALELSHVPYLGDDVEDSFIIDLIKSYDGNYHVGKNENVIDDDMFVDLVKALMPDLYNATEDASSSNSIADSIPKMIFEKILEVFPPTTTAAQLYEKYMHLTAKISELKPNIDDANAMAKGQVREDYLSSYRKYFCRRCFMYNCELHGFENNNPSPRIRTDQQPQLKFEEPCSDVCYKHLKESVSEEGIYENNSQEKMFNPNPSLLDTKWSLPEETMFLALLSVFPNNCCAIAETMITKSCQQVYEYFKMNDLKPVVEAVFKKKTKLSKTSSFTQEHAMKMYKPCDHEGDCNGDNVNCSCINCEKFCNCPANCRKRFRTCTCNKQCDTNRCFCFNAYRECSPDTCQCCTSDKSCKNTAIQQGLHKNVKIAPSDVHGWGLFMHEICQKGELIGEYRGEIISKKEADRRAKVYQKIKFSYMFHLNDEFVIDGAKFGSNVRFINHSKTKNCEAKVMMVNGDHRIGIYAYRTIQEGEELFLDYETLDPTESKTNS